MIEPTIETQPNIHDVTLTTVTILFLLIAFMICIAITASVYIYRQISKHAEAASKVLWEDNKFYESDNSTASIEDENKFTYKTETESPVDGRPMVPDWLKNRKEMVYPQNCIERCRQLGSGQFGTVFMGKLVQGTAVYVIYLFFVLTTVFTVLLLGFAMLYNLFCRFPIAIKTLLSADPKEVDSILNEAKSMLEIGRYHNHIVNLQGITYDSSDQDKVLSGVRCFTRYTTILNLI